MKTLLVALFVAALVALALFAQAASAQGPSCTLGYCPLYDTQR
jgi:hypothetical protein